MSFSFRVFYEKFLCIFLVSHLCHVPAHLTFNYMVNLLAKRKVVPIMKFLAMRFYQSFFYSMFFNPLNAELNPICYLLALLAHHFLHVSRIMVKSLTLRLLMSYIYIYIYIYMEHQFLMFLDHTQRRTTVGRTPLDE